MNLKIKIKIVQLLMKGMKTLRILVQKMLESSEIYKIMLLNKT